MTDVLDGAARQLRANYDHLSNGDRAVLRRCRTVDDVLLEGAFWRCAGSVTNREHVTPTWLAQLVLLFGSAAQRRRLAPPFGLGRYLAQGGIKDLRFRQLVRCRDREELLMRLARLLRQVDAPVDWGTLGTDLWFFFRSDQVRQRWTQDYYTTES